MDLSLIFAWLHHGIILLPTPRPSPTAPSPLTSVFKLLCQIPSCIMPDPHRTSHETQPSSKLVCELVRLFGVCARRFRFSFFHEARVTSTVPKTPFQ